MLIQQKMNDIPVSPFDMKLRSSFMVRDLLSVNLKITDRLRANFNKKLDGISNEVVNFIASAFSGDEYVEPDNDADNIANGVNYFPEDKDFVFGKQFLTNNNDGVNAKTALQHQNSYSLKLALWLFRQITFNPNWNYSRVVPINFWIFDTGAYIN